MRTYSLRLRLLVGGMVAIFLALAVSWVAMTVIFARHVERRIEIDLEREAVSLVAALSVRDDGSIALSRPLDDHRFERLASGVYWQVSGNGHLVRSRSLWDQELDGRSRAGMAQWSSRMAHGPYERTVFLVERKVRVSGKGEPLLIQMAQDGHELHIARVEFGRELAAFLALLWLVLSLAGWVQVTIGLRSLRRLGPAVVALKRRPGERLLERYPSEIAPLVEAINALADAREADVRRARQRAADLAHAMKTPIAALAAQSRRIATDGSTATKGLDRAIASVSAAVEAELARARAAASRQSARAAVAAPAAVVRRLVSVLERTEKGMRTDFVVELPDDFRLRLDEADLTEMLGALLENATRFARRTVLVSGGPAGEGGAIRIDDDGPGLSAEDAARVLGRGIRLDEREGGHGLGVSIARELADATEGTLVLSRADLGGLRAEIAWAD